MNGQRVAVKPLAARAWLLSAAFWTLCGVVSGLQIWISMIAHHHSLPLVVFYQVLMFNGWLAIIPVVRRLVAWVPLIPLGRTAILVHLLAATILGLVHTIYWTGLVFLLRPYDFMNPRRFFRALPGIVFSGLPMELLLYIGVVIAIYAIEYYEKYRDRETRALQLETSLAEARLHALELQIQPHFLFNTLNAISSLVRAERSRDAVVMIAGLSDLLRYTLDHAGDQRVTIEEEAAILRRYLEIQRMRFADRLTFDVDVSEEARTAAVPTLILQPLAENAIRHGISRSAGAGRVEVRAFRDAGRLRIEVFNTGVLNGAPAYGIGLRNTTARLAQLYGDQQSFALRNDGGGVLASLAIPWNEVA